MTDHVNPGWIVCDLIEAIHDRRPPEPILDRAADEGLTNSALCVAAGMLVAAIDADSQEMGITFTAWLDRMRTTIILDNPA